MERDLIVGGQAVMEGVMMRTPSAYAIACRKSDGEIVTTAESLPKWSDKYKWLSWPVLRGGATLIQSLALGIKALNFSAKIYEDDLNAQKELTKETVLEPEPLLVEGTTNEDFTKAPVQVVNVRTGSGSDGVLFFSSKRKRTFPYRFYKREQVTLPLKKHYPAEKSSRLRQ